MIISALDAKTDEFGRAYTIKAAVNKTISAMNVGEKIEVERMTDALGRDVPRQRLDVIVSKIKGQRRFKIHKADGLLAVIYRLPDVGDEEIQAPI